MVTELDLVKAKPNRVIAYLKTLAKAATRLDSERELKLTPSKEDLVLAREKAFREKVEVNIKEIETNIAKTLYRLNSKFHKAKEVSMQIPSAHVAKGKLKRKSRIRKINVVNTWVGDNSRKLAEIHKIKQKLRILEEKSLWLSNKGYDSKKLHEIQTRIDKAKDLLYLKLGSLLEEVVKDKIIRKQNNSKKKSVDLPLEHNVVCNLANGKYHRPKCRSAKAMSKDNKEVLENENAARKKGYRSCKLCFPKE